jgi:hypothetical protein
MARGAPGSKEVAMRSALVLLALSFAGTLPAFAASDWCYDNGDWIYAEVADGTITVHHDAAFYNCGPDSIAYTWEAEGNTFVVVETEWNPQALCYCCYDLTTEMEQVPPGAYVIDFAWDDFETGPQHRILEVVVPDEGQSGDPHAGGHSCSPCLDEQSGAVGPTAPDGARLWLRPAEPNPAGARTALRFEIPAAGHVTLAVYSCDGARVRVLLDETLPAGPHAAVWDGRSDQGRRVSPGLYFCGLTAGGEQSVRRVLLVR